MWGDVVFTYISTQGQPVRQTLLWAERINSRECLGIWRVGSQAWKVYSTRDQYTALSSDYRRAAIDAGLPMGKPFFQQGTVQRGEGRVMEGFILVTEWMLGTNFAHTARMFGTALTRENFPHGRVTMDYQRMQGGASAANIVGLRDPQGFLKAGLFEPLRFIDVHTGWNSRTGTYDHSEVAEEILEIANAWGQRF